MARHRRSGTVSKSQAVQLDPALEDARPTDIVIPIMGDTGSGKSTFINRLLEHIGDSHSRVKVGDQDQLIPCTVDLQSIIISNRTQGTGVRYLNLTNEYRIVLLDTPGFENDKAADFQILKRTSGWVGESLKRKMILGGVIYMHDMSLDRYSDTARGHLTLLNSLCGDRALFDKVVFVTSKWSRQGERDFAKLEAELKDIHWKDMLQKENGATVMRLDPWRPDGGEGASAWEVVSRILRKLDRQLNRDTPGQSEASKSSATSKTTKPTKPVRPRELAKLVREQREEESRIQAELSTLDASTTEGDAEARAKIREKEEKLRMMQEAVHRTKASLFIRLASRFRRMRRSRRVLVMTPSGL